MHRQVVGVPAVAQGRGGWSDAVEQFTQSESFYPAVVGHIVDPIPHLLLLLLLLGSGWRREEKIEEEVLGGGRMSFVVMPVPGLRT
jgi:hypothetical protein